MGQRRPTPRGAGLMSGEPGDGALVARSREGDAEAFRKLFDRKYRRVYLIAYQILGDQGLAEDVVQEVFLTLWERSGDYDDDLPLDPWLRRMAANRAIDHWRQRARRRRGQVEVAPGRDPDAVLDAGLSAVTANLGEDFDPQGLVGWRQLQAIWDEIASLLPAQQRAAFVLRHIEGITTPEVAEALGCSASTVRSHVAEARRVLKGALDARYPELLGDS